MKNKTINPTRSQFNILRQICNFIPPHEVSKIARAPEVKNLIKKIAANSAAGAKLLEAFARHDLTINLEDIRLPPGETATRDAIASTKKKELLGQSGDEFELTLLLTQTEALSYAWHLAKVAGENESQPDRARALAGVSKDMENLYHEVFVMLLSKSK